MLLELVSIKRMGFGMKVDGGFKLFKIKCFQFSSEKGL